MQTWTIDDTPNDAQIRAIAATLQNDGVVLLPTDTIYGLHAVAQNAAAVARLVEIKGRDETKPFVVLCANQDQFASLGVVLDRATSDVLGSLWPAPLTAILPLREPVPASRGTSALAIRIPALDWLRALAAQTGPLVSTSANRSGEPPIMAGSELPEAIRERLDGVVDAGRRDGEPSTIVDFTGPEPRLIREGSNFFTQKVWKTLRKSL